MYGSAGCLGLHACVLLPSVSHGADVPHMQERLLKEWAYLPGVVATSAVSATGRVELLAYIAQLRELFMRAGKPSTARVRA